MNQVTATTPNITILTYSTFGTAPVAARVGTGYVIAAEAAPVLGIGGQTRFKTLAALTAAAAAVGLLVRPNYNAPKGQPSYLFEVSEDGRRMRNEQAKTGTGATEQDAALPAPTNPALAETVAYWPHTTANHCGSTNGDEAGIDLFDSPYNAGYAVIYVRYSNGLRWPARSVDTTTAGGRECLASWATRGTVNDYRATPAPTSPAPEQNPLAVQVGDIIQYPSTCGTPGATTYSTVREAYDNGDVYCEADGVRSGGTFQLAPAGSMPTGDTGGYLLQGPQPAPELTPTEPMPTTPKPAGKFPFAVARRNGDRVILLHQVGKCAVARVYPADKSPAYHLVRFRQHYADFEGLDEAGAAFQALRRLDNAERHRDAETLRAADALDQLTVSRPCLEKFCEQHGLDVGRAYPRRELRQAVTDLRLPKMAVYLALLKTLNPTNLD